jgi:hypothetical protein
MPGKETWIAGVARQLCVCQANPKNPDCIWIRRGGEWLRYTGSGTDVKERDPA